MAKVGKRSYGKIDLYRVSGLRTQRDNDAHAAGDADIDSTKTKKPKTCRENNQPTHLNDVSDSEGAHGHSANSLTAAKEKRKGSNAVVANHTHAVEEQMQRLKNTLDDRALKTTMRHAQLQASFNNVIASSRRGIPETAAERPKEPANEKLAGHAIYQNGVSAISLSRELMTQYDRICDQTAFKEGATKNGARREDECEALQRVLQKQGHKVKLKLHHFLHGESKASTALPPDETLAVDNDLWSRYAVASKQEEGKAGAFDRQDWAVVAKHAQRGVHRMVKVLPDESG